MLIFAKFDGEFKLWQQCVVLHFQYRGYSQHLKTYDKAAIIFVYKQVICQARDKFSPDNKPVWLDKKSSS